MASQRNRNEAELLALRCAYAKQVILASGVEDARLEAALAKLRKEAFLDPGPWPIMRPPSGYEMTPDDNPVHIYQDVLVGMVPEKGLNSGQPSFVTFLISLGRLRKGGSVTHIGAGQGYYTAVIAQLVGDNGRVTAIEYERDLAIRAAANLSSFPQVRVIQGDGCSMPLEPSDVIYVNAGAVRPANTWLDAMKEGGCLIMPFTVDFAAADGHVMTKGTIFLIERKGEENTARWKSETGIYSCVGARDERS